jgi:hypothetical protein
MFRYPTIGFAAAALLSLGTLLAPAAAFADAGHCNEYPEAPDCRTYNMPGPPAYKAPSAQTTPKAARHAHYQAPQSSHKG